MVSGRPGVELQRAKANVTLTERILIVQEKVYILQVMRVSDDPDAIAESRRFLESFRLVG
jgi:hypothetical protein